MCWPTLKQAVLHIAAGGGEYIGQLCIRRSSIFAAGGGGRAGKAG